jgi:DNA-binding NarL/FixJ family response regulator
MSIRVLLADDHTIMRQGLKALLEREPKIEVIAEAADGQEAVQLTQLHAPHVVVMDLTMPKISGIEATRQITAQNAEVKVLAFSMVLDRTCVVETLKAGAMGYLLKDCAAEELVGAIQTVAGGAPYLCPQITALVIKDYAQSKIGRENSGYPQLSKREREVLQLIAAGKNTKEIAFTFGVSSKTIEIQRMNVMKKLNLYSIAELTKYAVREGLTTLN